jgi:hypothetical protein
MNSMGARARLFLLAFLAIAIAAISHPSLGAGATYSSDPAPVVSEAPAEAPTAEPPAEPPVAEPLPVESPVAEPPPTEPPVVEPPVADPPPTEPPVAEPPTAGPPPSETPAPEPVDTGEAPPPMPEGLDPAVGAPVETPPTTPDAPVLEEPESSPIAKPGQSVVIQTPSEGESVRPIPGELRAVLLADAPSSLSRLADVSSVGTTARTASGRPARGPVERPISEVRWPLEFPSPDAPPVPSRLAFTFNGQAASGSSFRADLALALSAVALGFSLMARVARPVSSRFHEAALVTRVPQPG